MFACLKGCLCMSQHTHTHALITRCVKYIQNYVYSRHKTVYKYVLQHSVTTFFIIVQFKYISHMQIIIYIYIIDILRVILERVNILLILAPGFNKVFYSIANDVNGSGWMINSLNMSNISPGTHPRVNYRRPTAFWCAVLHANAEFAMVCPVQYLHLFALLRISVVSLFCFIIIPVWISNYIHYKVWGVITCPLLYFNGAIDVALVIDKRIHTTLYRACGYLSNPCWN